MIFLPLVMTSPPHRGASCEAKETRLCSVDQNSPFEKLRAGNRGIAFCGMAALLPVTNERGNVFLWPLQHSRL